MTVEAEPDHKKRRVEEGKSESEEPKQPNVIYRCQYEIPHKNRTCAMHRKKDQKYCSQHAIYDKESRRIPCPLDPSHTVWEYGVAKHLKKCNARPKEERDPWFCVDTNKPEPQPKTDNEDDKLSETEIFDKYLSLIKSLTEHFAPLRYSIESHDGLSQRLAEVEHQKHPLQQSSLAGNLNKKGLLGPNNLYVEFGCGKAELSRFLNLCVLEEVKKYEHATEHSPYGFGLIDRGVNRMKNDPKITKETEAFNKQHNKSVSPKVKRTRIDIKDLKLDVFVEDIKPDNVVAISKHLCGVATDLTLRSILNSKLVEASTFKGLLVAMCCRHVCDYDVLLPPSRDYLASKGFATPQSFKVLKKLVSWAVSTEIATTDAAGNTSEQRRQWGLIARRLIDESRLFAVRQLLPPNYDSEIFWYVKPEVTLENVCLNITKKENQV